MHPDPQALRFSALSDAIFSGVIPPVANHVREDASAAAIEVAGRGRRPGRRALTATPLSKSRFSL
jgi:hypothetical protein